MKVLFSLCLLLLTPAARADFATCGPYISMMYLNGVLTVSCPAENGGAGPTFSVTRGDSPNVQEVEAFVQPYIMAVKTIQVIPASSGTSPMQNFKWRLGFYYTGNKISGMRMDVK